MPSPRTIGTTPVPALGFGCMGFGIPSKTPQSEEESLALLTAAADRGLTFWVTSDAYGPSESLLGKWFQQTGRRSDIFLVTKFGIDRSAGKMDLRGDPEYVKQACQASLTNLQTNYIDLYMQHRVDPAIPIEHTVAAMKQLQEEGKIRYLGLSECSERTLRRASKVHPIAAAEMEYSLFAMDIEDPAVGVLAAARELGVKIIAYSPLGRGFLTGAIRGREDFDEGDMRLSHPRFSEENFAANLKLVEALEAIAAEKGCTVGQLALAWLVAQGDGE
ncbi:Aldo/keto reductase [Aspergillus sclerotiicarbonarius CBS 121057]|uniref:Aldo/keto reductase n=1 Tax=Aspergillus sclerotiicarbonarius (strain CBS 121057 / IBT 28362) TaxID=1448318 RepID=A0A319ENJ0_ASPSB|nr:Aldo/keto reductase [Aspergillus sclerotiicarbonarius CBS 121057]